MNSGLTVASFFSGCGGFDLGFKRAGYNIVLANDLWEPAAKTYMKNFPETDFLLDDIHNITEERLKSIMLKKGVSSIDIVIGGPPCQCFTRLNNNHLSKKDKRNQLFREYIRVIKILKPKFVVMENVFDLLVRRDEKGNLFKDLIYKEFKKAGYESSFKVLESNKYGVPQKRKRAIFIATNTGIDITFPTERRMNSTVGFWLSKLKSVKNLSNHEMVENNPKIKKLMRFIPAGGYYEHLPNRLKTRKVRNGKLVIVKRYGSYLRRLDWNTSSITVTKNYIIHPTENRYLTNREKATLHTFPPSFKFEGGTGNVAQLIANAVPPLLAQHIANHILELFGKLNSGAVQSLEEPRLSISQVLS